MTDGEYKGKFTVGYNGRFKNRDFEATQFNFKTTTFPSFTHWRYRRSK